MKSSKAARKRRVVTYLGGLIVFATFIVHEVVREKAKDKLSEFDARRSEFSEHIEVLTSEEMTIISNGKWDDPFAKTPAEAIKRRVTPLMVRLTNLVRHDGLEYHFAKDVGIARDLQERLEKVIGDERLILIDFDPYLYNSNGNPPRSKDVRVIDEVANRIQKDEDESATVSSLVDWDANFVRSNREGNLAGINYLTYVLFAIGWIVNLGGRLIGDDKEEDTDWEDEFSS